MSAFYPVEIELEGRKHRGEWTLRQGCKLCVGGFYGAKTVDLGDRSTIVVAREVLRELVLDWLERERRPAAEPRRRSERPFSITVLVDGHDYSGTWRLLGGQVFVASAYGDRAAAVKRSTPERVAERLLKELVTEWKPKPSTRRRSDEGPNHPRGAV